MGLHCMSLYCSSISWTGKLIVFLLFIVNSQAPSLWEARLDGYTHNSVPPGLPNCSVSGSLPQLAVMNVALGPRATGKWSIVCLELRWVLWRPKLDFFLGYSAMIWFWVFSAYSLRKPDL